MAQQQVQLCIITGQALANLIPLLQEKPQHVVLMYSNDKKNNADAFVSTLLEAGFQKEQIQLEAGLPFSPFNAICEYAIELIERVRNLFPEARLTWNATGGTKQMALAVWDMLDLSTDRVIYCDTRSGVIEELSEEGGITPLASLLTPELYLHALGKVKRSAESDSVVWRERAQERKAATRHLAENAESLVGLIQTFNRQLKKDGGEMQFLTFERVGKQYQEALDLLEKVKVLVVAGENKYALTNAQAAEYLTGAWLEEYVWHVATDQGIDYVEAGLKFDDIRHRKEGQSNELDGFIVHNNRLLLVECKSGWMGKDQLSDSGIIYRLDSVGINAGGSQATRLLVSAQQLQHKTSKGRKVNTAARASATDIQTIAFDELKNLKQHLLTWKESGSW